jgi:Integrase core domain/Chromo (CHRromatin Organisation MOdifier) domain
MEKVLSSIYYEASNPGGYSSAAKLLKAARLKIPTLTLKAVKEWLSGQLTYTLHKPARRKFTRNRIIVERYNEQWQADLVDMQEFAKANGGYRYILTVVDILSKYAYAVPLKNKKGETIKEAFVKLFKDHRPEKLQTDQGTEFVNQVLKPYLKKLNICFFTTKNVEIKCAVVERFNRTLKSRMFKYFTSKGHRKYIEILPQLMTAYNGSIHSTTKMRPCDVNETNEKVAFRNTYGVKTMRDLLKSQCKKPKLVAGEKVRIKHKFNPFDKGYYPNWTDHIYNVEKVIKGIKPLYKITSYDGQTVDKRFYPEELQKVSESIYRVEKVLKKRTVNGRPECFVKWLNYPASYNSWIPEADVQDIT